MRASGVLRVLLIVMALLAFAGCGLPFSSTAPAPTATVSNTARQRSTQPVESPPSATPLSLLLVDTTSTRTPTAYPTGTPFPSTATPLPPSPTPAPTVTPLPTPSPTPEPCPGAIAWERADEHVGETITIIGPVVGTTYASTSRGRPTFLNIGLPYPDPARFTVLIWVNNRHNFATAPEDAYLNQIVCVSGEVLSYRDSLEMEITGPEQIVVVAAAP